MSNWGISPHASKKEKIKADYADILHGMDSVGAITYDVYSDLFDDGMELLDRMYEQGKADAVPVVRCKDCIHWLNEEGLEDHVCLKIYSDGAVSLYAWQNRNPDDFCSYGERKDGDG